MTDQNPNVIYIPPTTEQIQKYSLNVCKTLRSRLKNDYFYENEFIQEFTHFMNQVIKIQTKHLNPPQEEDHGPTKEATTT